MPIAACPFWYLGLNSVLAVLLLPAVQVSARPEGKRAIGSRGGRGLEAAKETRAGGQRAPGASGSRVHESSGRDTGTRDSRAFLIRSPGFNSPFFVPPSSFFWLRLALYPIPGESKNRRSKKTVEESHGPARTIHSRVRPRRAP